MDVKPIAYLSVVFLLTGCSLSTQSTTEREPYTPPAFRVENNRSVSHPPVVSYGSYSPYYWVSEPDSYYPASGFYSPGYQYHYTTWQSYYYGQ